MITTKDTELTPMNKEEYRVWENYVIKYNEDNPTDQIAYEVNWKDNIYKVKLLSLKIDNEGQE